MRMTKYLLTSLVCAIQLDASAQKQIVYKIVDDTVVMSADPPVLRFNVELTNLSGTNLLLYGFRNTIWIEPEMDSSYIIGTYKEDNGGNILLLMRGKERVKIWENINSLHDQDLTGAFQKMHNVLVKNSLEKLEVLNAHSLSNVEMSLDLSNYGPALTKGVYSFYLIYSSGQLTKQILGSIVTENEAKYKAVTLTGYIVSNQAALVVK